MIIRVRKEDHSSAIEVAYDKDDGLEVLNYQLMSIFPDSTGKFLLFDFAGMYMYPFAHIYTFAHSHHFLPCKLLL